MAASITDEQIERLHLEYAQTGRLRASARAVGISVSTAKRYIDLEKANPDSVLEQVRTQKRIEIAEHIGNVQAAILRKMEEDITLGKASYQELATAFGILTDKRQLITGQATERHEHRDADTPRAELARRIDELAERRRAKQPADIADAAGSR